MLAATLPTSHKVVILIVAGIFIVFALCSAFVFPRLNPNFPGRRMGLFIGASAVLTVGMLVTLFFLAREPEEANARAKHENAAAGTAATTTSTAPSAPAGDAAAGKALFAAQGCSACHTFAPAGSTAKVGPDLGNVAADAEKANKGSTAQYVAESIKDPSAYVVPGYPNGVMPPFSQLSDMQVADLVAFITAS